MSPSEVQGWIAVVGGLFTALVGLLGFFNYRTRRDYSAMVGEAFSSTVDALSDEKLTKQIAAAVLLRRFFDKHTEQGRRRQPYRLEAINVIAGMLREEQNTLLQKALADGLRYARRLKSVDLQQCNLMQAYLGERTGDKWVLDISHADLYGANLDGASLRKVKAKKAVFFHCSLKGTVFEGAVLTGADFRDADLAGAKFGGADLAGAEFGGAAIEGAKFKGAKNIPAEVVSCLNDEQVARAGARVPEAEERQ
jgi:uncharacterized protein YjbI with pentapeptide repeats